MGEMAALTGTEAVERARRLVPVLRERAAKTEALRRLPDETFADLVASGLLRITQPSRFGGHELGLLDAFGIINQLRIETAETLIQQVARRVTDDVELTGMVADETRARGRRDFAFSVRLCVEAVEELFLAAGASTLDESSPIQRCWRDVHAVAQHPVCNLDVAFRSWGERGLGLSDGLRFP